MKNSSDWPTFVNLALGIWKNYKFYYFQKKSRMYNLTYFPTDYILNKYINNKVNQIERMQ